MSIKVFQYNDNKLPGDKGRANSRNVLQAYIYYTYLKTMDTVPHNIIIMKNPLLQTSFRKSMNILLQKLPQTHTII
jgi:hypothetical protein